MAKQLSAKLIDSIQPPPGKKEVLLYDGNNLMLRVRNGERGISKNWLLRYSIDGLRKKLSLGTYPITSLAEAREAAASQLKKIEAGIDPHAFRANAEALILANHIAEEGGTAPSTIGELFSRWDKDYLTHKHKDQGQYVRGLFTKHVLIDKVNELKLDLTKRQHVVTILNRIRDKGLTRTCGVVLSNLRQMFAYGIENEWTEKDPTYRIKPDQWNGASVECDRYLMEDEIKQLYKALQKSNLNKRWKAAIWFVLAVGTRVEETLLAERAHINLNKLTWRIPQENQKKLNKVKPRDREIALSAFALKHLQIILESDAASKFVFPASRRNNNAEDIPVSSKTFTHALRDRQRRTTIAGRTKANSELILTGGTWTPHDLRRTMSTQMQELEIAPDIIDKCQGHVIENKIRRIYQRSLQQKLMAEAWDSWGQYLEKLLLVAEEEFRKEMQNGEPVSETESIQ